MSLPQAWMRQAESDHRAAQRLDNQTDPRTRCQAISKYQQCVEKSVKAVLDKLHAAGLIRAGSDRGHRVARYASVLTRFPATQDGQDLLKQMQRLFTPAVLAQIKVLDSLVPEYPAGGALARRNHEYPFQDAAVSGMLRRKKTPSPPARSSEFRHCASTLVKGLRRILDALELLYPSPKMQDASRWLRETMS